MRDLDAVEIVPRRRSRALAIVALAVVVVGATVVRAYVSNRSAPAPRSTPLAAATPPPLQKVLGLQFVSAAVGFVEVYKGEPGRLYRTVDAGQTWQIVLEGPPVTFHFFDSTHGVVWGSQLGVLATEDGGTTWNGSEPLPPSAAAVAFASTDVGIMLLTEASNPASGRAANLLQRTADGGRTWKTAGFSGGTLPANLQAPFDLGLSGTDGWFLSRVGGGTVLYLSRDAGLSWSVARLPEPPSVGDTPSSSANRCATKWLTTSSDASRKSVFPRPPCSFSAGLWKMRRE